MLAEAGQPVEEARDRCLLLVREAGEQAVETGRVVAVRVSEPLARRVGQRDTADAPVGGIGAARDQVGLLEALQQ